MGDEVPDKPFRGIEDNQRVLALLGELRPRLDCVASLQPQILATRVTSAESDEDEPAVRSSRRRCGGGRHYHSGGGGPGCLFGRTMRPLFGR